MKALVYHGPKKVSVDNVPDAKIEKPADVVIGLTTTNICGSDLHMYEGRTDVEKGKILGHENLGEVLEVGMAVDAIKKGDKVVLPFNIGCGFCANCERGLTGYCLTCADPSVMPGMAGAAYGFAGMGPMPVDRRSICASPMLTLTAYGCRQTPTRRRRTTLCFPISSRPAGMPPASPISSPASPSSFMALGLLASWQLCPPVFRGPVRFSL
jgi:NADPH:quinone reductase-like Zn-dependent oxidoreductase